MYYFLQEISFTKEVCKDYIKKIIQNQSKTNMKNREKYSKILQDRNAENTKQGLVLFSI